MGPKWARLSLKGAKIAPNRLKMGLKRAKLDLRGTQIAPNRVKTIKIGAYRGLNSPKIGRFLSVPL